MAKKKKKSGWTSAKRKAAARKAVRTKRAKYGKNLRRG